MNFPNTLNVCALGLRGSQLGEPALHLPTPSTFRTSLHRGFVIRDHAGATARADTLRQTPQDAKTILHSCVIGFLFCPSFFQRSLLVRPGILRGCVSCAKCSSIDCLGIARLRTVFDSAWLVSPGLLWTFAHQQCQCGGSS